MWKKILSVSPEIEKLIDFYPNMNFSFELYGSMNKILILYDIPLDYALLFAVNAQNGDIMDPEGILFALPLKSAKLRATISKDTDLVSYYKKEQAEMESGLKVIDETTIKGEEGLVWYLHTIDGSVVQLKCKPPTIEGIHWAAGKHISVQAVMITIRNSLESSDDMDYEYIKSLLLEEFEEYEIDGFKEHILKCMETIKSELEFKEQVLTEYKKIGITLAEDKKTIMRTLSKVFPASKITGVYNCIENYEALMKREGL
jgi:hypothetical protein